MNPEVNIIKSIQDEFDPVKVEQFFKPLYDIMKDEDKSLQRKLQLLHNKIVAMRKEFDSIDYFADAKERNKELNRLKYHRKKNQAKVVPEPFIEYDF